MIIARSDAKCIQCLHYLAFFTLFLYMYNIVPNFFSSSNGGNILKQDYSVLSPVRFLGMKMKNPKLYQKMTTLVSHRKTKVIE